MSKIRLLKDLSITANSRVLLRVDLNTVPLPKPQEPFYKLDALMPTIRHILDRNAHIVLVTHLGRPSSSGPYPNNLSTRPLLEHFKQRSISASFAQTPETITFSKQMTVLENARFFPGEYEGSDACAQRLASCADFYVNDAFGLIHRNDSSTTRAPLLFDCSQRAIGLLVEQELSMLKKVFKPEHPFIIILGGKKIETKLTMLLKIIQQAKPSRPDSTLFGGALALALNKALNNISSGTLAISALEEKKAREVIRAAREYEVKIIVPSDFVVEAGNQQNTVETFADNETALDIGTQSQKTFTRIIKNAKTIVMCGPLGKIESEGGQRGTQTVLKAISRLNTLSFIGGGETADFALKNSAQENFSHISTGGGAFLAALACGNIEAVYKLPGLAAFTCD